MRVEREKKNQLHRHQYGCRCIQQAPRRRKGKKGKKKREIVISENLDTKKYRSKLYDQIQEEVATNSETIRFKLPLPVLSRTFALPPHIYRSILQCSTHDVTVLSLFLNGKILERHLAWSPSGFHHQSFRAMNQDLQRVPAKVFEMNPTVFEIVVT